MYDISQPHADRIYFGCVSFERSSTICPGVDVVDENDAGGGRGVGEQRKRWEMLLHTLPTN